MRGKFTWEIKNDNDEWEVAYERPATEEEDEIMSGLENIFLMAERDERSPKGKWVFDEETYGWPQFVCSICGYENCIDGTWPYCPNCGCVMEETVK